MSAQFDSSPRSAYSINETARLLDISRRLVYDLLSKGKLRSVRIGARQRIPALELERLVNGQARPVVADALAPTGTRQVRVDDVPTTPAARHSGFANCEDFGSREPAAPPPKPRRPPAQPARVRLSDLLRQTRGTTGAD